MPIEDYSPETGGAIAVIIKETAEQLITKGHEVTVLSKPSKSSYRIGKVIHIKSGLGEDQGLISRLICKLQRKLENWDWPYYGPYINSVRRALALLPSAPDKIIFFNDLHASNRVKNWCPSSKIIVWLQNEQRTKQTSVRETEKNTYKFLTCSEYIKRWTIANHGIKQDKVAVAISGVNNTEFYPDTNYKMNSRVRCLVVGRLDPNKGQDIAVEAVARLQAENLAISLTLAGDVWFYLTDRDYENPYRKTITKAVSNLLHSEFLGHVEHNKLPSLYREHELTFVLSRTHEPFGLVVLEAMASGCAVICSNRGGLPEAGGDAALQVDPDDFDGVCAALRRLCNDRSALEYRRKLSLRHAQKSTWLTAAEIVETC